jgi:hypothetical protein
MNMFVGSAAIVGASVIPDAIAAAPAQKPDIESARPELRNAFEALKAAYYALMDADMVHHVAWDLYKEWEKKNPMPGTPRAFKKWARRSRKYLDEIKCDEGYEAWSKAKRDYREAQHNLGVIRAGDFNEIKLKAAASLAFEGGVLDESRRHLRSENQIVAWSIAMDAILLGSNQTAHDLVAAQAS